MDFLHYLNASARTAYTENPMTHIKITTPADLFNPAAQDGVLAWVGLRFITLSLVVAFVASVVA